MRKVDTFDEQIRQLYVEKGMTMKKIASELNIFVGKVYNRITALNIPKKKKSDYKPSEKMIKHITKLGKSHKGKKLNEKTKEKISLAKFKGGIGHKKKRADEYIAIYFPEHPKANKEGYIMEHDLVMECVIGRHLKNDEVVHHKNHKRDDNRVQNLQLMTFKEHAGHHMRERHQKRRDDLSIR